MQPFITLEIPPDVFGQLATVAALEGVDITRWVKRKIQSAAADGTLARIAADRKAKDERATAFPDATGAPLGALSAPSPQTKLFPITNTVQ